MLKSAGKCDESIDESIKEENNKLIKGRIKELESFNSFNQELVSILKKELTGSL